MKNRFKIPITIESGESLAPAISLAGLSLVGIEMPSAWTTAALSFKIAGLDAVDDAGSEISIAAAASVYTVVSTLSKQLRGANQVIVRSGVTATPVTQLGDRTLNLIVARV